MSEQQSLSHPPPAEPQPPEGDGASKNQHSSSLSKPSKRRGYRIDRLFIELDQEAVDPNAIAPPTQEAHPTSEPSRKEEVSPRRTPSSDDQHLTDAPQEPSAPIREFPALDKPTDSSEPDSMESAKPTPESAAPQPEISKLQPPDERMVESRPYTPRWSETLGFQAAPGKGQDSLDDEEILPSNTTLTDFSWESLGLRQPVAGHTDGQYSTLAYALPFGENADNRQTMSAEQRAALLLEIVDDNPERLWSEEELLLVEQVTDQLSLALENARLFEEARTRSEYLAILNEMSRALSTQLNSEDVIETVYSYSARLVDATNFYLALYDEKSQLISFPLVIEDNQRVQWRARPVNKGLTEHVIQMCQPVLIRENVSDWIADQHQIEVYGPETESWLGVPMIFGDQVIGVIAVQNYERVQSFDETDRDLLNAVASQAAVALSNAQLFEQTQNALSALEVSERYQKSVANAVAILTERGIAALSDVLEILGNAAGASRAYYIETQVDARGSYWRLITEWHAPGVTSLLGNPTLRRLSTRFLAQWLENLRSQGYVSANLSELTPEEREFLESLDAQSILQFAVGGRHEIPGCIGFEQVDHERTWGEDEISALQTAASALANTIAREDLFTQVQLNLAETEALYQASARLNSAVTYDDILQVLRQHTILGHVNASSVMIHMFDRNWEYQGSGNVGARPDWLIPLARWSAETPEEPPAQRYSLDSWPAVEALLQPERPTIITDIEGDSRIDEVGRKVYLQQMNAKSLLYVPLNVAGKWIGHIIAVYRQTTGFPEQEVRRLTSLAGQAAIAVSSLLSLEEARQRNEELTTLNQITAAASETLDLKDVLEKILERLLTTTGFGSGLISIRNPVSRRLELAAHQNLPETMVENLTERGLDGTPCDLVYRLNRTIHFSDLSKIPETSPDMIAWKNVFEGALDIGFKAYLGVPLESKGKVLGTVCIFNPEPLEVDSSGITLLKTAGQQVGVLVENAGLFQETQNALSETETLYEASAELSAVHSYNDILATLCKYSVLGEADTLANISLFNRPWHVDDMPSFATTIAHLTSLPPGKLQKRNDLTKHTAASMLSPSEATIFENIPEDPRLDETTRSLYIQKFQANSAVFVPLAVGGEWIGYIHGAYSARRKFSESEKRRLTSLAGQAAIAVQNLRLLGETRRRANQLQTAAEIARDTSSTFALDALLERSVNLLRDRFGYYHASIFLLDKSERNAVIQESTGEAGAELKRRGHSLPVGGSSVIGQVTASGKPLVLSDVTQEDARARHYPNPLLPNTRAELGIPLQIGGRVIGALNVQSTQTDAFSEDDIAVLQTLADQIAVAVDNARAYELTHQAMEDIREAERLKSQFLANMSHELRTPLNSIIGFSRVILKGIDGPINELQQQDLSAIYNSGQHLLGLINDVLDLSKIEAGKMEIAFEENVNLVEIIKGVMSTTVGLVKDKPVELIQNIEPDIPLLRMDAMKIRQVLLNFLSNAAKFTEEGSITVGAELQTGPQGEEEVLVCVTDTGPGIAPEDQKKLFQPFSQVDGSLTRKTGGSGLGLSICQHLIHMHGGRIGLRSTVGSGSTFYFSLPTQGIIDQNVSNETIEPELPDIDAVQMQATADLSAVAWMNEGAHTDEQETPFSSNSSSPDISAKQGVVLAIDPDPQIIDIYRRYLTNHGFTVIAVTELDQATQAARGIYPTIITLDISMQSNKKNTVGRLDGWQVLSDLKANPDTQDIPVVVCSLIDEPQKAYELGADDYLVKPILEHDLVSAFRRLQVGGFTNTPPENNHG